ncbi:MAG: EamA family transporter [Azospirillaceae bacterium]|nr:EamA family transporter [Azospirillaceae bacterium]
MARDAAAAIPAPVLTLGSMLTVQIGAALSVPLLDRIGTAATAELRLLGAAIILLVIAPPRLSGQSRRSLGAALALGIATAFMTLCYYQAIARLPMGMATTIDFLGPLAVAIAGSRRALDLLWALLAGTGVLLLAWNRVDGPGDALGLMFAAGAGLGWAAYIVLTKRVGTTFRGVQGLSVSLLVAALAASPVTLTVIALHHQTLPASPTDLMIDVGFAAMLALPATVLPFALEMAALRRLAAWQFGILMSAEPAISALCGYALLEQRLCVLQIAGVAAVSIASAGVVIASRPRTGRAAAATVSVCGGGTDD